MRTDKRGRALEIFALEGLGEIEKGDSIADLIAHSVELQDLDVVVVTQKIVSKAEGRTVRLEEEDLESFEVLVRSESRRVLRRRGELMITETHHGFVCANAGIDRSNVADGTVALLPKDPDRAARNIRHRLEMITHKTLAVVITDTFGRAWRNGVVDVAIGCAGIAGIHSLIGECDTHGRVMQATEIAIVDEIASAADLVKGKTSNTPVVVLRGIDQQYFRDSSVLEEVVRDSSSDLFR